MNTVETKAIAYITMDDATVYILDTYSSGQIKFKEVCDLIESAIYIGRQFITIGGTRIDVNKVWSVRCPETDTTYLINEDNDPKIEPISKESIEKMEYRELSETINTLMDWSCNHIDEDDEEEGTIHELLDTAIDELKQKYCDEVYEKERLDHILFSFLSANGLFKLFEKHIEELKQEQNDPEDKFHVAEELYGDLNEFMRERPEYKERV
ncbi:hypothetical protein [Evansella tamaricis]|uniref:Uncharacterized protein n=1 Tax=Evansella tamaricis TaxID=2069301 RepID=A0ABS6JLB6_9BACI|nr:hypothetical protein [Evansella tamaricis]MBU9714454.1 hypothetical protein [Evansella tamaricis]